MVVSRAAAILALVVACALAVACGGDAGARRAGSGVDGVEPPTAPASVVPTVTPRVTPQSPKETFVYLLGGSSARECIVSNADWTDQLEKLSGSDVRAYDLGCHNQTFATDIELVKAMDPGPTIVIIGLSAGRYTSTPSETRAQCDGQDASRIVSSGAEVRHQFTAAEVLSDRRKRQMLDTWVSERYPLFRRNYPVGADGLERLIKECKRRRFQPLLLELPVNFELVGDGLDTARARYGADARRLARRLKVPYLDFGAELGLPNTVFYDLMHLVEPGRAVWQKRLSKEVVALLER